MKNATVFALGVCGDTPEVAALCLEGDHRRPHAIRPATAPVGPSLALASDDAHSLAAWGRWLRAQVPPGARASVWWALDDRVALRSVLRLPVDLPPSLCRQALAREARALCEQQGVAEAGLCWDSRAEGEDEAVQRHTLWVLPAAHWQPCVAAVRACGCRLAGLTLRSELARVTLAWADIHAGEVNAAVVHGPASPPVRAADPLLALASLRWQDVSVLNFWPDAVRRAQRQRLSLASEAMALVCLGLALGWGYAAIGPAESAPMVTTPAWSPPRVASATAELGGKTARVPLPAEPAGMPASALASLLRLPFVAWSAVGRQGRTWTWEGEVLHSQDVNRVMQMMEDLGRWRVPPRLMRLQSLTSGAGWRFSVQAEP